MHSIVLKMSRVQMSSGVLVDSVLAEDSSEVAHGEEIGVVPGRSGEAYGNGCVGDLVVSLEH